MKERTVEIDLRTALEVELDLPARLVTLTESEASRLERQWAEEERDDRVERGLEPEED